MILFTNEGKYTESRLLPLAVLVRGISNMFKTETRKEDLCGLLTLKEMFSL